MVSAAPLTIDEPSERRRSRRANLLLVSGCALLVIIVLVLAGGPLVLKYGPNTLDYAAILTPPGSAHLLGTDALGRDLLARIIYGGYNSLFIGASNELGEFESGVVAALIGLVPAIVLGGVGTLCVAAIWAAVFPALRRRDLLVEPAIG